MMFAAELNLGAAFTALAIGGALLALVWVLDRKALRRELEVDEELVAVELLHDELLEDESFLEEDELDTEPSVKVLGPMRPGAPRPLSSYGPLPELEHEAEPEPVAELEPEPLAELEAEPEPDDFDLDLEELEPIPRRTLPKGAEAVLAALTEVIPDPRNTVVRVKDPTAEISVHRVERPRHDGDEDDAWSTPSEPSGAELMARQRDGHSTRSSR